MENTEAATIIGIWIVVAITLGGLIPVIGYGPFHIAGPLMVFGFVIVGVAYLTTTVICE